MIIDYKAEFQKLLDYHQIRHFNAAEVLYLGASHYDPGHDGFDLNELPPLYLWANIIPTLQGADQIRERLGVPVYILSAFRGGLYNSAIGGHPNSNHKLFKALDLATRETTPQILARVAMEVRTEGIYTGGLGTYDWGVHIDWQKQNRTWSG